MQNSSQSKSFVERTHSVRIDTPKNADASISIGRELIETIDGDKSKSYRAVGVKEAPDFKPLLKLSGSQLLSISSFDWVASDGSKRTANGQDLYNIVKCFCDHISLQQKL